VEPDFSNPIINPPVDKNTKRCLSVYTSESTEERFGRIFTREFPAEALNFQIKISGITILNTHTVGVYNIRKFHEGAKNDGVQACDTFE